MAFKMVPVKPDVKDKIQLLKVKWGLRTENEVVCELIERSMYSDDAIDNAVALIKWVKKNA